MNESFPEYLSSGNCCHSSVKYHCYRIAKKLPRITQRQSDTCFEQRIHEDVADIMMAVSGDQLGMW